MKRFSKILAVLLTVGVLLGMVALVTSAEERENNLLPDVSDTLYENFRNNNFTKQDGKDVWGKWTCVQYGGNGEAAIWQTRTSDDGNQYFSITYNPKPPATSNANSGQVQLKVSDWSTTDALVKDHDLNGYDYAVIDFEFGFDEYTYFDGENYVTYTPEELAAAFHPIRRA